MVNVRQHSADFFVRNYAIINADRQGVTCLYDHYKYFNSFSARIDFRCHRGPTSDSDVYLDGPRAERVHQEAKFMVGKLYLVLKEQIK